MKEYDEAISILKGQIDTHNQKICVIVTEIERHEVEAQKLDAQRRQYIIRISNLNTVLEYLHEIKAKT